MFKFAHKGKVRKVPLTSIFISNPFTQVTIGLVGPSRTIDSRSEVYTLIECVPRFPEAIPLRNEDLVTVAGNFSFSTVGMSIGFLSHRGRQLKSDLMKEVNRLLSIKTQVNHLSKSDICKSIPCYMQWNYQKTSCFENYAMEIVSGMGQVNYISTVCLS